MRLGIAVCIVLLGCGSAGREAPPDLGQDSPTRRAAVQAVSSAAVASLIESNRPSMVYLVNTRATWSGDSTGPAMARPAWADFVRQSREPGVVPPLYGPSAVQRVSSREFRSEVTDTAVIALSGVGLSPSAEEAVIFVDYRCGTRCGIAMIATFERRGETWVLSRADTTARVVRGATGVVPG